MSKIELLERKVRDLYEGKSPGRDDRADWADWLYEHHVFVVADYAVELARRYEVDVDLCKAAAILHDVADAEMKRFDPRHEERSLEIARELLADSGFSVGEIEVVVDDAIKLHSCHDGKHPNSLVGKVLATADALAHLRTDFYIHGVWALGQEMPLEKTKEWARKKIPRDYNDKILFDEVKQETKTDYDLLMELFSR